VNNLVELDERTGNSPYEQDSADEVAQRQHTSASIASTGAEDSSARQVEIALALIPPGVVTKKPACPYGAKVRTNVIAREALRKMLHGQCFSDADLNGVAEFEGVGKNFVGTSIKTNFSLDGGTVKGKPSYPDTPVNIARLVLSLAKRAPAMLDQVANECGTTSSVLIEEAIAEAKKLEG